MLLKVYRNKGMVTTAHDPVRGRQKGKVDLHVIYTSPSLKKRSRTHLENNTD